MRSGKGVAGLLLWGLVVLLVSPGDAATAPSTPRLVAEGAPTVDAPWWTTWSRDADGDRIDDAIVRLQELHGQDVPFGSIASPFAVQATPDGLRFNVFVRFAAAPTTEDLAQIVATTGIAPRPYAWAELVYVPNVTYTQVQALVTLDGVRGVELERIVVPMMDIALPALLVNSSQTFGKGARERWKVSGAGVGIAFLDTGIDEEHEAFDPSTFLGGYDATVALGNIETDPVPRPVTPLHERNPDDDVHPAHGTHVASLAVANDPNGTYVGAAPGASFLDVKVIMSTPFGDFATSSTPYGLGSMVLEGLDFVRRYNAGESHLRGPNVTVRVISMSIAELRPDPDGTSVLSYAVNRMVDAGFTVVAAAGNCGPTGGQSCCDNGFLPDDCTDRTGNDTIPAPGAAKRAITVGAMDAGGTVSWLEDRIASFSSRGPNGGEPKPNVVAYGVDIMGAKGDPSRGGQAGWEYQRLSGTSMATPFVAGIAALLYEANGTLDADAVKRILVETARHVSDVGWDPAHGSGVVNAYFAVGVALGVLDARTTMIDAFGHDVPRLTVPVPTATPTPTPTQPPMQNRPPNVDLVFGPTNPDPGEAVVFAGRANDPDRHALVAYVWDFGDGTTGQGDRLVHAFERAGTYKVRLTVTDEIGLAASASKTIIVGTPAEVEESPALPLWGVLLVGVVWLARPRRDAS